MRAGQTNQTAHDDSVNCRLAKIRKENFRVEVGDCEYRKGEIAVTTTHNGFQWQSISLTRDELQKVSDAILEKLKQLPTHTHEH